LAGFRGSSLNKGGGGGGDRDHTTRRGGKNFIAQKRLPKKKGRDQLGFSLGRVVTGSILKERASSIAKKEEREKVA